MVKVKIIGCFLENGARIIIPKRMDLKIMNKTIRSLKMRLTLYYSANGSMRNQDKILSKLSP